MRHNCYVALLAEQPANALDESREQEICGCVAFDELCNGVVRSQRLAMTAALEVVGEAERVHKVAVLAPYGLRQHFHWPAISFQ